MAPVVNTLRGRLTRAEAKRIAERLAAVDAPKFKADPTSAPSAAIGFGTRDCVRGAHNRCFARLTCDCACHGLAAGGPA